MPMIRWYFDFISPFAYLQWHRVRTMQRHGPIELRPVLLAGLLGHHGQKGPAEIPGKREFTYRHVQWRAGRAGIAMRFPPAHPFNPLAALRLCIAAGSSPEATDAIFNHIWRDGLRGDDLDALAPLASALGLPDAHAAASTAQVKAHLLANGEQALGDGVFGVPTLVIDGTVFWGEDATDMAEDFIAGRTDFGSGEYRRLQQLPIAASRK